MDIESLITAAREEGGEQGFADLVQTQVQDAVTAAVEKLATEKAKLATDVEKLAANNKALTAEWVPIKHALKEREIAPTPDGLTELFSRLDTVPKDSEPTEAMRALAREMAEPMAKDLTRDLKERIAALEADLESKDKVAKEALTQRDQLDLQLAVSQAEFGEDRPKLLPAFRQHFIDSVIAPFVSYETIENGAGKPERRRVVSFNGVPIMTKDGKQAGVADLYNLAYEARGDKPYNTGTRDFFQGGASGGGAKASAPGFAVTPSALEGTMTVAAYEKLRNQQTGA